MRDLNTKEILELLWQNKFLIIALSILGAILGYIYNNNFTKPQYTASSKIILSVTQSGEDNTYENADRSISSGDLSLSEKLMNTYVQIIKSDSVINKVIENLNLDMKTSQLNKAIEAIPESKSTVLKVTVTLENPEQAKKIVCELENVFFERIEELYNIKTAKVLDDPTVDRNPSNIKPVRFAIIGLIIGFIVASSIVIIKELLNDNIKTESDIEKNLKLSVLTTIGHLGGRNKIAAFDGYNYTVEQFRVLAANIKVLECKTVLVVSNVPGEGKSVVSANLAATYAASGKKTLLIDSDMRKGTQHWLFGIENGRGLSNLVFEDDVNYTQYIHKNVANNLDIITKGSANLNYSKLLFSETISKILNDASSKYDYIIVDGTPCQMVADGSLLFNMVDATAIVIKYNNTKASDVIKIYKGIQRNGGKVLGAILNDVPKAVGKYDSYYENPRSLAVKTNNARASAPRSSKH